MAADEVASTAATAPSTYAAPTTTPAPTSAAQAESAPAADSNGAVTEDEAALYDRQIRLWGLEAQNRLRTAHVLILGWNGIATEIIKNTVLSGIGSITLLDPTRVEAAVDLLTGFFFRDDDVGRPRCSQVPLDRVRALNPLVKVEGIADQATYDTIVQAGDEAEAWLKERGVDVVVIGTPLVKPGKMIEQLVGINALARKMGIKSFVSATYGLGGFYFADQVEHDYVVERNIDGDKKRIKQRQTFVSLADSLAHTWVGLTDRQKRRTRIPLEWFAWLALTHLRTSLASDAASTTIAPAALRGRTVAVINEKGLDADMILRSTDAEAVFTGMAAMRVDSDGITLAPVAAVLGGVLSQDILNAIGGREEPVVNWMMLSFNATGAATVHKIGSLSGPVVE
ncbi:sumo-activating enzyme subunit 1 [Moesziomyces antarcticus]|uniref:Related to AOS1 - Smt3p activating protein n=1 Tax=Pseudozyma antarctica TaxID=84753 RepID=A0A5C3FGN9_PSEA2|nr:sumo-activating enzyme subunit 1 [Moesziomyces antarcticus]GAK62978.1 sumo-activating enzyme subunit 1 [Moesziomyces antarcticus]SPO43538.1 related to AOS1 - Smt3p activating protein [Moesziomyces antarcticus]